MVDIFMDRDVVSLKTKILIELSPDEIVESGPNLMGFIQHICGVSPRKEIPYWYPSVGEIWHWEPMKSHASQRIKVVEVKMNENGEYWIGSVGADRLGWHAEVVWNEIGRWMEAAVLVEAND